MGKSLSAISHLSCDGQRRRMRSQRVRRLVSKRGEDRRPGFGCAIDGLRAAEGSLRPRACWFRETVALDRCESKPPFMFLQARAGARRCTCRVRGLRRKMGGGWPQSGAAAILLTDFKSLLGEAHGTALHCRSGLRDRKKLVIVSDVLRRPEPRLDPRSEPRPRLQPGGVPLPREGTPLSCSRAPRVRVLFRPELEEWFQERVPR